MLLVSAVKLCLAIYRLVQDLYLRQLWTSIGSNQRPQRSRPIVLVAEGDILSKILSKNQLLV